MSTPADVLRRRALTAPGAAALLLAAAVAWFALVQLRMTDMSSATGFLPVWALMMAAMMLPSVTPVATLYARTVRPPNPWRLGLFAAGYLVVWAVTALPAYGAWTVVRNSVLPHPLAARLVGAAVFAACGLYQLTPYKERCLRHCRSPIAQLMRYASYGGRTRDLRVGLHHAGYCLGCCWALMLLLFGFGAMSVAAAAGLAAVVVAEKLSPWGRGLSRAIGVAALVYAVVVLAVPAAAPGLQPMPAMSPMPSM